LDGVNIDNGLDWNIFYLAVDIPVLKGGAPARMSRV
jgi:hypothetical protein